MAINKDLEPHKTFFNKICEITMIVNIRRSYNLQKTFLTIHRIMTLKGLITTYYRATETVTVSLTRGGRKWKHSTVTFPFKQKAAFRKKRVYFIIFFSVSLPILRQDSVPTESYVLCKYCALNQKVMTRSRGKPQRGTDVRQTRFEDSRSRKSL